MKWTAIRHWPTKCDGFNRRSMAKLPVLGVCLGSQLLAKALGSRVYANRVKEIGWYEVELLPAANDDRLFGGLCTSPRPRPRAEREKVTVFQWHGDTFDLPKGAVQLARSAQCENQAFRFGEAAYGLQFHMEVTAEIIDSWLCQSDNCGELADVAVHRSGGDPPRDAGEVAGDDGRWEPPCLIGLRRLCRA